MDGRRKPLTMVLVKPAGADCNLDCEYCFYLDRGGKSSPERSYRMDERILEEIARQLLTGTEQQIAFVWQGGEPTLMGLKFFRRAVELQEKYGSGKNVSNAIQTNGILLDDAWGSFLKDFNFLVGLSIDGPEHIHDHYRRLKGGQGSWSGALAAARMLRDHDVEVNAVSVVTEYSAQHPEAVYAFHKDIGLNHMQFIPCVETDRADSSVAAPFSVSAEAYGKFLITLFDLWRGDFDGPFETTSIRLFDSLFHEYVGLQPPECTFMTTCGNYVVVEHNGDVYVCDFFVEPRWKLGNILEGSLSEMLNSSVQHEFGAWKSVLPHKCRHCRWLSICNGGCTKDRIRDPRDGNLSHFCRAYEMFFAHADEQFRALAAEWKNRFGPRPSSRACSISADHLNQPVGRNGPCPCGSGRKYKRCCGMMPR